MLSFPCLKMSKISPLIISPCQHSIPPHDHLSTGKSEGLVAQLLPPVVWPPSTVRWSLNFVPALFTCPHQLVITFRVAQRSLSSPTRHAWSAYNITLISPPRLSSPAFSPGHRSLPLVLSTAKLLLPQELPFTQTHSNSK